MLLRRQLTQSRFKPTRAAKSFRYNHKSSDDAATDLSSALLPWYCLVLMSVERLPASTSQLWPQCFKIKAQAYKTTSLGILL